MFDRRELLKTLTATGFAAAPLHPVILTTGDDELTRESLRQAAWITGYQPDDDELDQIVNAVKAQQLQLASLRKIQLDHYLGPAFHFQTLAKPESNPAINRNVKAQRPPAVMELPADEEAVAFLSISDLSHFIRTRLITSQRLTAIYLARLKKFGPMLRCVVNLTEELAMTQAERADSEIADGNYRGPLHGIPWGAKDLIAVPEYPTTWGIPQFKDRVIDVSATVYKRLEQAGAVLVAKLSMGAIAMGDQWFAGLTRNPWNPRTGSSGSSAGSASATVAGLVGFSLGTETLGSITTPSRVCGATGFRPTFGRVSRFGCMPLSWTMDKVGPICRSAEDCALVFAAIHGADGLDLSAKDVSFDWPVDLKPASLKIGYASGQSIEQSPELQLLQDMGCQLVEAKLPTSVPLPVLANIINLEAAAGFDQMLRDGQTEGWNQWKAIFQTVQFVSAIDYIRLMRLRTTVMHEFEAFMADFDFLFKLPDVFHTNLTGHPSIVIPCRYRNLKTGGKQPVTASITGHLNDDARLLAFAAAFQQKIGPIADRPALTDWLQKYDAGELDQPQESPKNEVPEHPNSNDGDWHIVTA